MLPSAGCKVGHVQESCRCGRVDTRTCDAATGTGRELQTDDVTWEEAERWEGGDEGVGGEQMSELSTRRERCREESEWEAVVCF